jgi:apolipoprotein N-acyltransferase
MKGKYAVCLFLVALSGLLLPFALPNDLFTWGSPFIGLFALVPLFFALSISPSPRFSFLLGAVYGLLFHGISAYWLWFFKDFRFWTLGSTLITYAIVYGGVCSWLSLAARATSLWRPFFLVTGWVAYEFMKSIGFLAFPYGLIAYSWVTVPAFNQLADITGLAGPSFILTLANVACSEALLGLYASRGSAGSLPRPRIAVLDGSSNIRLFALAAACFALSLGYGAFRLGRPVPSERELKAVIVQPNADSWMERNESNRLYGIMDLTDAALGQSGEKPDVILWTETTIDQPYDEGQDSYYARIPKKRPLRDYIKSAGVPLITGMPKVVSWERMEASNAVGFIDGNGQFLDYYAKMHPVPFAEAIPFWEYKWMRDFMARAVGMTGGWTMGSEYTLFSLPLSDGSVLKIAPPICFEISFADQCRVFSNMGADVLLNLTNVSWSQRESAEIQHCVTSIFRAIENRRTVIQSTNGGVSCWVDASGFIHDPLPVFVPASEYCRIPIQTVKTPTVYGAAGDALSWLMTACFALASAAFILKPALETIREVRRLKLLNKGLESS